jgi:uroporphyrinogen decarboxylase
MKPRERLMRALRHEEPDRVPIDIGTAVTSIHREAYMRLKEYRGLDQAPPRILDPVQQVVELEEPVLRRFKVDKHIERI